MGTGSSAELSWTSKYLGETYLWVKSAFGLQFDYIAIWFQSIEMLFGTQLSILSLLL